MKSRLIVLCSALMFSVAAAYVDDAQAGKKSDKSQKSKKSDKSDENKKSDKNDKSRKSDKHRDKVEICHYNRRKGTFKVISVSERAVDKHIAKHGDELPGTFYSDVDGDGLVMPPV